MDLNHKFRVEESLGNVKYLTFIFVEYEFVHPGTAHFFDEGEPFLGC